MNIADLPPAVRARVAERLPAQAKKRGMNRLERAFGERLRATFPGVSLRFEDVTLRLGHDCRYTPDWFAAHQAEVGSATILEAYEVKGFRRDDAMVKLRVAAREYPWIAFHLVERGKRGEWKIREIHA